MVKRVLTAASGTGGCAAKLAVALGLAAACASVQIPRATQADARRAAAGRPETTLAELERGRTLYLTRCSACHQPVAPASILPADWPEQVAAMKARARLEPAEEQLVLLYLVTMAATAAEPAAH